MVLGVHLAFLGALIVLSFIDLDHMLLPDEITVPGMILAVVLSAAFPALHDFPRGGRYAIPLLANVRLNAAANSLIGMGVGAGMIYITGVLGKLAFRKEAMGFGDVKLMGLMGGILGTWFVVLIYFIGPIFGVVFGIVVLATKGEHHIPYGPFLSLAAATMLLGGPQIIEWVYGRFHPMFQMLGVGGP
ncbi:MAG: A24 family peptidase [Planctomycetota bacterium]